MNKFEQIKERYAKGFVSDMQLLRYLALGVIDKEQYEEIYAIKYPAEVEEEVVEETTDPEEVTESEPEQTEATE